MNNDHIGGTLRNADYSGHSWQYDWTVNINRADQLGHNGLILDLPPNSKL